MVGLLAYGQRDPCKDSCTVWKANPAIIREDLARCCTLPEGACIPGCLPHRVNDSILLPLQNLAKAVDSEPKLAVTNRGLNIFFAKKLSYYVSGTRDLSLYQFTTAADIVEGRFSFNYNQGFFRDSFNDQKLKALLSIGMETDALQGIGKLWSAEKKWNDDIGINLKLTIPFPGATIKFDKTTQSENALLEVLDSLKANQKDNIKMERDDILLKIKSDIAEDVSKFINWYDSSKSLEGRKVARVEKFIKTSKEKYQTQFFEEEAKALEEGGKETYNVSYMSWLSLYGYIPVTTKGNDYIKTIADTAILANKVYRFYFNADVNFFLESTKFGSVVFRLGYEGRNMNEILAEKVTTTDITLYKQIHQNNDTILFSQIEKKQPYLGSVKNVYLNAFNLQVTVFPKALKYVGLNVHFQAVFKVEKEAVKYPSKLIVGIPFSIPADKEGEKRVNIEPQLVMDDILNQFEPAKSAKNKLSFGLKLGLPLGSIIYKASKE
jgi:hypothetical protein